MEKNKNLKEIVIKIEGEKWEKALDKAFKKANATAKIDAQAASKNTISIPFSTNFFITHHYAKPILLDEFRHSFS